MRTIHVHKPFKLVRANHEDQTFGPGAHEVDDDIASHWFVQAHTAAPAPEASVEDQIAALEESIPRDQAKLEQLKADKAAADAAAKKADKADKAAAK